MSRELAIEVVPVASCADACAAADTVLLATKATEPVLDASSLRCGAVVLSIGSTRPKLRELDRATLTRTAALLFDDIPSVGAEPGDIIDALEHAALEPARMVSMGAFLRHGSLPSRDAAR